MWSSRVRQGGREGGREGVGVGVTRRRKQNRTVERKERGRGSFFNLNLQLIQYI
jgi:hypothetical protein